MSVIMLVCSVSWRLKKIRFSFSCFLSKPQKLRVFGVKQNPYRMYPIIFFPAQDSKQHVNFIISRFDVSVVPLSWFVCRRSKLLGAMFCGRAKVKFDFQMFCIYFGLSGSEPFSNNFDTPWLISFYGNSMKPENLGEQHRMRLRKMLFLVMQHIQKQLAASQEHSRWLISPILLS